jgi:4-diphosphocytidyl-2-C-methyl-D-erythritol kinase
VTPRTVTVSAAAKINLHLGVGRRRDDGFHDLHTVYQAISIHSTATATPADSWALETEAAAFIATSGLPSAADNLATRAAYLLAGRAGREPHAHVRIEKGIPVAGGLAGGSADAAATLVALDRLWELRTPRPELLELAAELGSDVPFSLIGRTALGVGRGERVEPVHDRGPWWWVVVPDQEGLSTPSVYASFDELCPDAAPTPPRADALIAALATGDPRALAPTLFNGLQEAAFSLRPGLRDRVATGEEAGALKGLVSGSGPTCVFLCESADHAEQVAGRVDGFTLLASGPVPGPLGTTPRRSSSPPLRSSAEQRRGDPGP